jgi:hypothetical protein
VSANDLEEKEVLGTGNFGRVVSKMIYKKTGDVMAVKVKLYSIFNIEMI